MLPLRKRVSTSVPLPLPLYLCESDPSTLIYPDVTSAKACKHRTLSHTFHNLFAMNECGMPQQWQDAVSNLEQIIELVSFARIPPPQVFLHFQFSKACDISSNLSGLDLRPTQYIYPICLNHLLVRAGRDILRFRLVGLFQGGQ